MLAYNLRNGSPRTDYDVVIIGTGIGGSTLGYALAHPSRSILFLEQGQDLASPGAIRGLPAEACSAFMKGSAEQRQAVLARAGRNAEPVSDGLCRDTYVPFTGSGTGGSSAIYGMVLERLFPQDFDSWPIDYAEMAQWYAAAESLYEVCGGADPLRTEAVNHLRSPPPFSPANQIICDHLTRQGFHPYRIHLASRRIPGCKLCQGFLCPGEQRCRNDAFNTCLQPALAKGDTHLLTGVRVTHLETSARQITAIHALDDSGNQLIFRAKVVALAAGALNTPRILLQSGNLANRSGLVGRRLMRHLVDLFVLTLAPRIRHPFEAKEFALNDFYFRNGDRLGTVQSFGPMPGTFAHGIVSRIAAKMLRSTVLVASIAEDSPDLRNGVELNGDHLRITYRSTDHDQRRRVALRRHVTRSFLRFGPVRVLGKNDRAALAHVCGTARFGDNPDSSVLDRFNRAHDFDNLYVVDTSFFPTSGGMNPALTVAANALRVANHLQSLL